MSEITVQQAFFGQDVEYLSSLQANSVYASGLSYIPLAKNATEQYIQFQFLARRTGTLSIYVTYAMSAANTGDVVLRDERLAVGSGEDPNGALATGQTYTFTPGNDANLKEVTCATLLSVSQGEIVTVKLTRRNVAGDTHTGTFNVIGVKAVVLSA